MKKKKFSIKNVLILLAVFFGVLFLGPLIGFGLVKSIGEKQATCCMFNSRSYINICQEELKEFGEYQDGVVAKSACEEYEEINFCKNSDGAVGDGMTCGVRYIFSYIFISSIISFFAAPLVVILLVIRSQRKKTA